MRNSRKLATQELSVDYGRRPPRISFSHPAFEQQLVQESEVVQRHYYELKEKFPHADNDYSLLLVARHVKGFISKLGGMGNNSGINNVNAYLMDKYDAAIVALRAGVLCVLDETIDFTARRAALFFAGYTEKEFGLPEGTLKIPLETKLDLALGETRIASTHTVRNTKGIAPDATHRRRHLVGTYAIALNAIETFDIFCRCPIPSLKRFMAIRSFEQANTLKLDMLHKLVRHIDPKITWDDLKEFLAGRVDPFVREKRPNRPNLNDFFNAFAALIGENYTPEELRKEYNMERFAAVRRINTEVVKPASPEKSTQSRPSMPKADPR